MVDEVKKARTEGVEAVIELLAAITNERLEALRQEVESLRGTPNAAFFAKLSQRNRMRIEQLTARYDELQRLCVTIQQRIEAWPQEVMPEEPKDDQ